MTETSTNNKKRGLYFVVVAMPTEGTMQVVAESMDHAKQIVEDSFKARDLIGASIVDSYGYDDLEAQLQTIPQDKMNEVLDNAQRGQDENAKLDQEISNEKKRIMN